MGTRIFLALSALVWLPYGIYCFVDPTMLDLAAGLSFASPTGSTEIRAMYGGLQIGIGVLCVAGLWTPAWRSTALRTLLVLVGGLFATRVLGLAIDGSLSTYTASALVFEGVTVAAAAYFRE